MSAPTHDERRRSSFAAATQAETAGAAFAEALGGPLGIIESALPAAAFVLAYTVGGLDPTPSALVAVGISVVLAIIRLLRRSTVQFALSGLLGIAIAAFIVSRTHKAQDFFLPSILLNIAYIVALAGSIVARWPLIGVAFGLITQSGTKWHDDPDRVRIYSRVTWIWVGVFALRLAVMLPLYIASAVVALGVAKVALGLPVFAVGVWLSWLLLKEEGALQPIQRAVEQHERAHDEAGERT